MYPSVSLLCFPMSQSIFILSLCSPDDLRRLSLLIPSAPSLWSHYKPHIYLIKPAACLDSCRAERCAWERTRLCISGCVFVCVCHPCVCCALMCAVYYLTWRGKMSECKMSHVTYSVSWLLQGPAGQTQALFSIQNLHSESPLNNSNTTEVKIGAGSKSITVSFLCPCQNSEEIPC